MARKIAFLILAHSDPHMLGRLCRALGTDDDIFIHVDRKTPNCVFTVPLAPNARIIQPRITVHWADVSVVHATLLLIERALASQDDYQRLVLLSGSCYPIKPVEQLRRYFVQQPTENEIKFANLLEGPRSALRRIARWHFRRPLDSKIENEALDAASRAVRKIAYLAGRSFNTGFQGKLPGPHSMFREPMVGAYAGGG